MTRQVFLGTGADSGDTRHSQDIASPQDGSHTLVAFRTTLTILKFVTLATLGATNAIVAYVPFTTIPTIVAGA